MYTTQAFLLPDFAAAALVMCSWCHVTARCCWLLDENFLFPSVNSHPLEISRRFFHPETWWLGAASAVVVRPQNKQPPVVDAAARCSVCWGGGVLLLMYVREGEEDKPQECCDWCVVWADAALLVQWSTRDLSLRSQSSEVSQGGRKRLLIVGVYLRNRWAVTTGSGQLHHSQVKVHLELGEWRVRRGGSVEKSWQWAQIQLQDLMSGSRGLVFQDIVSPFYTDWRREQISHSEKTPPFQEDESWTQATWAQLLRQREHTAPVWRKYAATAG